MLFIKVSILAFLFSISTQSIGMQSIGPQAKLHAEKAGLTKTKNREKKILALMSYLNSPVLHRNQKPLAPNYDGPPPIPKGGTHPYEWDSIRSSEEMLEHGDGGSCGTFGLTAAALLIASGVPSEDIRIIGGVLNHDYMSACPGKKGDKRRIDSRDQANGHVYLQVKIDGKWHLLNTTNNILEDPPLKKKKSIARNTYQSLRNNCFEKYEIEPGSRPPDTVEGKKFMDCIREAKKTAHSRVRLDELEMTPFYSPEELEAKMNEGPTSIPVEKFPGLVKWMGGGTPPEMIVFKSWKFEDYPKHTFQDRKRLVASGNNDSDDCRYSRESVNKITKFPPSGGDNGPPPGEKDPGPPGGNTQR